MINNVLHWIAHQLGWNEGKVVTWLEDNQIFLAFECSGCGKIAESSVAKINESEILK